MAKRRSNWHQAPISSPNLPDRVPTSFGPPVGSLDRLSNGDRIGPCPRCGGHKWWDNRGRKRSGSFAASSDDFTCCACRFGFREGDHREVGEFPDAIKLPKGKPSDGTKRYCAAITAAGAPCRGGAVPGTQYCGPHQATTTNSNVRSCTGTTKAGAPCRAAAQRGSDRCPAHQ